MAPLPGSPFLRRGMGLDLSVLPTAMQSHSISSSQPSSHLGADSLQRGTSAPENAASQRASSLPSTTPAAAAHNAQHAAEGASASAAGGSEAAVAPSPQLAAAPPADGGTETGLGGEGMQSEADAAEAKKQRALARCVCAHLCCTAWQQGNHPAMCHHTNIAHPSRQKRCIMAIYKDMYRVYARSLVLQATADARPVCRGPGHGGGAAHCIPWVP